MPSILNFADTFADRVRSVRGSKGTQRAGSFAVAMKLFDVFDAHVSSDYVNTKTEEKGSQDQT